MVLLDMDLISHVSRQFSYNAWANHKVLSALTASRKSSARPRQLLAHILSAERLWLERIRNQPQSLAVWPDLSLPQCQSQISQLTLLWTEYLRGLSLDSAGENVSYKNSKGEAFTSTVEDILSHVLLHSAYHRGQIASQMRADGEQPPYTDFILAARQRLIE